jgi:fatty-acyl-CoA synthase
MDTEQETWWAGHAGYPAQVLSALAAAPDRRVIRYQGRAVTGGQHIDSVAGAYGALRRAGVGRGSVLAVLTAPNSPEMLQARHAAALCGAAVCYLRTVNPGTSALMLAAADQAEILRVAGATALYTDEFSAPRAEELARGAGIALVRGPGPGPQHVRFAPVEPADLALIMFTSGSTGRPKGIRVSCRAWDGTVRMAAASVADLPRIVSLFCTPLSHTAGPMVDGVLAMGGAVSLLAQFEPDAAIRAVVEHGVTQTFLATTQLYRLLDLLEDRGQRTAADAGLAGLRRLVYGGSSAAPARLAAALRVFGPALRQMYGTTESNRISFLEAAEHADPRLLDSVGRPFPEVEVGVVGLDNGEPVPDGEPGEVRVRSAQMMDGYLDEEQTAGVIRDGWYHTGDIGYRDERGYLHLLDRMADVAKIDGTKVYPAVVERELLGIAGVAMAVVYGIRDEDGVERLHAAITCRPGVPVDPGEIRDRVSAALTPSHAPERVLVLDELPMNASGKPDRMRLRRLDRLGPAPGRPAAHSRP